MTPEEAAEFLQRQAANASTPVEDCADLISAYRTKVAEHAELSAVNWLTDWAKFVDGVIKQTDMTRQEVLLWQGVLLQKETLYQLTELSKRVYRILVDLRMLHLHHHNMTDPDCEKMLDFYKDKQEPWKQQAG